METEAVQCAFAQRSIQYLGHVISSDGVATDPEKISAVSSWPTPVSVKELRGFLGLAGYYRKFVRNFGLIAKPLIELLQKNTIFHWTPAHEQFFQALKQALISAPVLALPNFSRPFAIETDASAGNWSCTYSGWSPTRIHQSCLGASVTWVEHV